MSSNRGPRMKNAILIRTISGILAFALGLQGIPTTAFAQEASDASGANQTEATERVDDTVTLVDDQPLPEVQTQSTDDDVEITTDTDEDVIDVESNGTQAIDTQAGEAVTYDLNALAPFSGRTQAMVVQHYSTAINAYSKYDSGDSATWYSQVPSASAPYAAGHVTNDTLKAMHDMTDFFRWLVGVQPLKVNCTHSDDLQAGALVRCFDFNHAVDDAKKPSDMSDSLWRQGAGASHNIIARGYTPTGSITGWMNEGYDLNAQTWDTLGHRYALIGNAVSNIQFGYACGVGIGNVVAEENDQASFYAFPSPGPMPHNLVYASESAWSLVLDEAKVVVDNPNLVNVRITNQGTGKVFTRSVLNGTVQAYDYSPSISFVQPEDMQSDGSYSGTYRIEVSGLKDVATSDRAKIVYATTFVDIRSAVDSRVTEATPEFSDLTIYESLNDAKSLAKVAAVLPNKVLVHNSLGATWSLPVAGTWKLDTANKCYTNSVLESNLPANLHDTSGLLKKIRVPYQISDDMYDSYNSLSISPTRVKVGGSVTVSVYRTNISTDTSRVFKVVSDGNGGYRGKLWLDSATSTSFDKKASDASVYGASHIYKVKGVTKGNAGSYVSIYFNKSWGDTAYVSTSIEKLSVIDSKSLADATITGVKAKTYTGKAVKQKIVVELGGKTLRLGTDYSVAYKKNKAVGTATLVVSGKGSYKGEQTITFRINPKKPTISKLQTARKKLTVTWKKAAGAGGYELQYATNTSFKGAKTIKVTNAATTKHTKKKLKSRKQYNVRIRAYKKVGGKTYRSGWSKVKTATTK